MSFEVASRICLWICFWQKNVGRNPFQFFTCDSNSIMFSPNNQIRIDDYLKIHLIFHIAYVSIDTQAQIVGKLLLIFFTFVNGLALFIPFLSVIPGIILCRIPITGSIGHIICEITGLNRYYCNNGFACKDLFHHTINSVLFFKFNILSIITSIMNIHFLK